MRRLIVLYLILGAGFLSQLKAQQTYMFTQYYFNPFLINPAIAGTNNYYQVRANNRFQWVGFGDGPITNALSMYGPSGSKKYDMGFGGNVVSDITGPVSTIALNGAYAYNFAINSEMRLSLGAALGFTQRKLDGTQVTMPDGKPDPALPNAVNAKLLPDASVGAYLYSSNFNVGFSANNLFNSKTNKAIDSSTFNRLKSHFFLTVFYKYYINKDFQLEPGIIIKAVRPAPIQMDLTCRVIYQNMVSGGVAFRTRDAVSVMVGYTYENKLSIAYAYDIGITAIRKVNGGSHEIMLAYRFNPIK
jgi:type IX secretion system PorP/SprF family membrane protein